MITALTTGLQTVTATGAVTPTAGVNVSGITGNFTVCVEVVELTPGATARIQLEDSVNAFTASVPLWVWDVAGQIGGSSAFTAGAYTPATEKNSVLKYQVPNSNFGVANGVARINVTALAGTSPSLSINAWIES